MPNTYHYSTIDEDTLTKIEKELKKKDEFYESIITAHKLALFLQNYDSAESAQDAIEAAEIQLGDEDKNNKLSEMIAHLNEVLLENDIKQLEVNPLEEELKQRMGNPGGGKKSKKYRKSRKGKKYRKSRKTTKRGKKRGSISGWWS